jgi:hypothetical protein
VLPGNLLCNLLQPVTGTIQQKQGATKLCQTIRDSASDMACTTRDERNLAFHTA